MFGTVPKSNREKNNVTLSEQLQSTIKKNNITMSDWFQSPIEK